MAFRRSFTLRCLLRSQAGLACCMCDGMERASRARSRVVLCVWRRRLPLPSLRRELPGTRHHLACHCPRRCRRRDRGAAALSMRMLCCSCMPTSPVALTGCGLLLHARSSVAAGAAGNKWQIQKWIFPTVWASTARALLFLVRCVLTGSWLHASWRHDIGTSVYSCTIRP